MRKKPKPPRLVDLLEIIPEKTRSPLAVILGGSREVAEFAAARGEEETVSYQMDCHAANQLQQDAGPETKIKITIYPDLWDVDGPFATVVYPVSERGERDLKIDMVEQAFHILQEGGYFIVLSTYQHDQLFPPLLKKIFGKVHVPGAGNGFVYWCQREGDRPRRRHEMTFQVQREDQPSLRFLSRPGTFSYGRFDNGARALTEIMEINLGEKILDLGCGCGTNGTIAGLRSGPESHVVFVDSNVRALFLAILNAQQNGLSHFQTIATSEPDKLEVKDFDVVLANPPYFARSQIARLFIDSASKLLRPGGRMYLVTKQPEAISEMLADNFQEADFVFQRSYAVFRATV